MNGYCFQRASTIRGTLERIGLGIGVSRGIFSFFSVSGRHCIRSIHHVRLHFTPKWSCSLAHRTSHRVFTVDAITDSGEYRFGYSLPVCCARCSSSLSRPANILNFKFLKKFVKHSNTKMEISKRLYYLQRLSVVSRHDRLRLFYRNSSDHIMEEKNKNDDDDELHSQLAIEVIKLRICEREHKKNTRRQANFSWSRRIPWIQDANSFFFYFSDENLERQSIFLLHFA